MRAKNPGAFREGTTIGAVSDRDELGDAWKEVLGNRLFVGAVAVEYGLAEETIALLEMQEAGKTSYEVGIGEAMRPYLVLYQGTDHSKATEIFLRAVSDHTFE